MSRYLSTVLLAATLASGAHADSLSADFDIRDGLAVPVGGHLSFALNADGTIAAALSGFANSIVGFGFASPEVNVAVSDVDPAPELAIIITAWSTSYGVLNSGFACVSVDYCAPSMTFRIGVPGEFDSVYEAIGSPSSEVDFIVIDRNNTTWAANATSVPEPAPGLLFIAGLGLLGRIARRRAAPAA